jgi:hypothetical protein
MTVMHYLHGGGQSFGNNGMTVGENLVIRSFTSEAKECNLRREGVVTHSSSSIDIALKNSESNKT